jgi:hypothetical protein
MRGTVATIAFVCPTTEQEAAKKAVAEFQLPAWAANRLLVRRNLDQQ